MHGRIFAEVTIYDLQNIISNVRDKGDGRPTQKKIKTVLRHMYKYAVKYGIITANQNLTPYLELDPHKPVKQKVIFNTRQINRLKNHLIRGHGRLLCWYTTAAVYQNCLTLKIKC